MSVTLDEIQDATDDYVETLQNYNIKLIVQDVIIPKYFGDLPKDLHVFEYPGLLYINTRTPVNTIKEYLTEFDYDSQFKICLPLKFIYTIPQNCSYAFGIFAIDITGTPPKKRCKTDGQKVSNINNNYNIESNHYGAIVIDNIAKQVWLWDSAVQNTVKTNTEMRKMVKALFPKYTLRGINICSGCGEYQPGAGDYDAHTFNGQNIFCHTWCLWFIERIIRGLSEGRSIETEISLINKNCKTPRQNLITIKKYAHYISENILEHKLPIAFNYIWDEKTCRPFKPGVLIAKI